MSEFTSGILFLRKDIRLVANYVNRVTDFNCIVNHLNSKWSVLFTPSTVSTEEFCENLSHKLPLLYFWNNEDHGWGYIVFLRGALHAEFNVEYETNVEEHISTHGEHTDADIFSIFKLSKRHIILLQEVLAGNKNVDKFKKILKIENMSWLNYDKCDEDVLDSITVLEVQLREESKIPLISNETTDLSPFRKNGQYGYINDQGDIVVPPIFDRANYFSNGLGRINYKGKIGFINHAGEYVIEPDLDWASSFSDNRCVVDKADRSMVINRSGELISEIDRKSYTSNWKFREGKVNVETPEKLYGFMNEHGSWFIEPTYKEAGHFNDGYAWVTLPSRQTLFINDKGDILHVPEGYRVGSSFSEGLAVVSQRHTCGVIDTKGILLLEQLPFTWNCFKEGLLSIKFQHQYGYIDICGNMVIEPAFDEAFEFLNGIAMVSIKGKTSFIDKSGSLLHKPQKYYNTIMFSMRENTIFKAKYKERFMYMSKLTGEPVFYLEEFDI
ncbi:WG repeat-containing protein [Paenibacillus sedimenti]|uniref:WG repeat-containing protein n=1 Tax=Paenibacillus sedimenti TaxID=2770274 RepID=A0A926KMM0_9BACL|nr:WG repeat-containing protein [Paenibacillus sedimenti]MBD0378929.1 WG repeat-containing protein [Paenibacillus sedimenti]